MSAYDYLPCTDKRHPDCNIAHARLRLEERLVRGLIRGLRSAGWNVCAVNDGQERVPVKTEREALDAVWSVDESLVIFQNAQRNRHTVAIILGNGIDCISDWSYGPNDADGFDAVVECVTDALYEKNGG